MMWLVLGCRQFHFKDLLKIAPFCIKTKLHSTEMCQKGGHPFQTYFVKKQFFRFQTHKKMRSIHFTMRNFETYNGFNPLLLT